MRSSALFLSLVLFACGEAPPPPMVVRPPPADLLMEAPPRGAIPISAAKSRAAGAFVVVCGHVGGVKDPFENDTLCVVDAAVPIPAAPADGLPWEYSGTDPAVLAAERVRLVIPAAYGSKPLGTQELETIIGMQPLAQVTARGRIFRTPAGQIELHVTAMHIHPPAPPSRGP